MQVQIESDEVLGWLQREGGIVDSVRIMNFDHGGEIVRGLGAAATVAKGKEVLQTNAHTYTHTHSLTHAHIQVLHIPRSLFLEPGGNSMPPE